MPRLSMAAGICVFSEYPAANVQIRIVVHIYRFFYRAVECLLVAFIGYQHRAYENRTGWNYDAPIRRKHGVRAGNGGGNGHSDSIGIYFPRIPEAVGTRDYIFRN